MPTAISPIERALTLAALSGSKIALGPTFLEASHRRPSAKTWAAVALGEIVLDKLGVFPSRYRPSLLIPHTLSAAWVAHESMKADGVDDPQAAMKGAAVGAAVAIGLPIARKVLGVLIPDFLLGIAEDALAVGLGARATGLQLTELRGVAEEAAHEIGDHVRPAARAIGLGV